MPLRKSDYKVECFTLYLKFLAGYNEKLPFVKPAPIDQEESKKSKKHKDAQKKKDKNVAEGVEKMDLNKWLC